MSNLYSPDLEALLKKNLRRYLLFGGAAAVLCAAAQIALCAYCGITVPVSVFLAVLTAVTGILLCRLVQHRIAPLFRTDRLMRQLALQPSETFSGIFRGMVPGKGMQSGVMMTKLRLDEGKFVGKEPVFRELSIPAVFDFSLPEEGCVLSGCAAGSIITGFPTLPARTLKPDRGRYQMPGTATAAVLIAAVVLWGGIYGGTHRPDPENTLQMGVCTPAHHDQTSVSVETAMASSGLDISVSYTNTIDRETVSTYLSTFGALDADMLILNGDHFSDLFENQGHPLDPDALTRELGFEPRFVTDREGRCTGVVLYTPEDPQYHTRFPKLIDWIAVEQDVPLVAMINPNSRHAGSGKADLALVHLLTCLAGN